ncbi:MAG: 50S ribosomal protein L19 [Patescibacteria group bacterium]
MQGTAIERSMLRTDLPDMRPGDTVRVYQKVKEGDKERVTQFEGVVLACKHGNGITGTVTVRKVIDGIGVERVFPLHLPTITKIEVLRHSKVRRAKLYYIRDKAGREVRKRMKQVWREAAPAVVAKAEEEKASEIAVVEN